MTTAALTRATIGVTLGDPTGIGPEVMRVAVISAIAAQGEAPFGDLQVRLFLAEPLVERLGQRWPAEVTVEVVPLPPASSSRAGEDTWQEGIPSRFADRCAFAALAAMVDAAVAGGLHAMVTGPVAKGIFDGLTPQPPGQTEYIAGRLAQPQFAMMLAGPKLRVVPVTTHVALKDVASVLTTERIVGATLAATTDLRLWLGIEAPRVVVCGLNPHAGEGGRLGDEETRLIAPAVAQLRRQGVDVTGPLPADGLFFQALQGQWDLVVCMYHDQALGPLKTVHFFDGWNQTCGLSVPRLSPDHGTAWGIAGQGRADPQSAIAAVALAGAIARRRL